MSPDAHVVLLGLMGSGKTSIGRRVAARLGRPLVDGDVELERRTGGRTAAEIADLEGIDALHELEAQVAVDALASTTPAVVGPAASTIDRPDVRRLLAAHTVVWLSAPAPYLTRSAGRKAHRPLLDDGDTLALFERQLAVRGPLAVAMADLVVEVTAQSKDDAAARIAELVSPGAPSSS